MTSTISNQTLARGETADLPLVATDEDSDSVSFSLVNAPAFATIINANPAARTATLRLAPTAAGTFNGVQVKADDGKSGTALSAAFNITVNEPANTCAANVPADRWKGEYFNNRNLSGAPVFVRDEGNGFLNNFFDVNSPSATCGVPADTFSARYTRNVTFPAGVYRFSASADDGVRFFVDNELKVDKWIDQNETRYDVEMTLSAGVHTLRLEFYDSGGKAAARLSWSALNTYPLINTIANQSVFRGQTVEIEITATDGDNDPVTFTLENAPAFVTLINANPAGRKATLRIAPPIGDSDQQFNLTIRASDGRGGQAVSNTVTVTVTTAPPPPPNRSPLAVAQALPTSVEATDDVGALITLDGSASSDPDGDALSYSWTDLGTVISTQAVTSIKLPIGTHVIVLTVRDGKGGVSSTAAQTVTISEPPPPAPTGPAIASVSPSTGKRGTTVNIVVTGSGFVQGSNVSFSGAGISTSTTYLNPNQLNVRVTIASNAFTTLRNLIVYNPGGASVSKSNAFAVAP